MGFMEKNTVENIVILLASVLIFNSLPKFQIVGAYFEQYPIIIFIVAILLLIYKDRIANQLGGK